MAIRKIFTWPEAVLQRVAKPVEKFDSKLSMLVSDMVETMRYAPGIGLAAPQVGESIRLIVIEIPTEGESAPDLYAVCNPEITKKSGEAKIEEGCLSCPGLYLEVDRAAEVTVEGQNPDGTHFTIEAEGLLAKALQHEIDHLNGLLFIDRLSPLKKNIFRRRYRKAVAEKA